MAEQEDRGSFIEWLGFDPKPDWRKARWLGGLIGWGITLLAIVLVGGTLIAFIGALFGMSDPGPNSTQHEMIRNIGLVLAALLGAPFVLWRAVVADKQARIASESLFNDKLSAAAQGLHARRQVTRVVGEEEAAKVLTEWQDDLVARAVAIDRLEGLVRERPEIAPRVAKMLSVYVRELSKEHPPAQPEREMTPDELREWANKLSPPRSDMERAAQTLGRLQTITGVDRNSVEIDLRHTNLQKADLRDLHFKGAILEGAHLEGADLAEAHLEEADLVEVHLEGANLVEVHLEGANLQEAHLEGADLGFAHLERSDLSFAHLEGANLCNAHLEGALMMAVHLEAARLWGAHLERASMWNAHLEGALLNLAHLEGAALTGARLKGAFLGWIHLNAETDFRDADLTCAAFKGVNLSPLPPHALTQAQVDATFGDASVKLPEHISRPAHWPQVMLQAGASSPNGKFFDAWRAWREERGC